MPTFLGGGDLGAPNCNGPAQHSSRPQQAPTTCKVLTGWGEGDTLTHRKAQHSVMRNDSLLFLETRPCSLNVGSLRLVLLSCAAGVC